MENRRRSTGSSKPPVRWLKEWVPQQLLPSGRNCQLLRWVTEDTVKALREKEEKDRQLECKELEPEDPMTEILFLCSYEGCGKTFIEIGALRKHINTHGERQYVCHYEGCGKKFLDSSKLKRHFLIHTGERDFVCPYEGCGKAFSLDFNLKAHMRTHSLENYHVCPYGDCGRRYTQEYKLKAHMKSHHEKDAPVGITKQAPPAEKKMISKAFSSVNGPASAERPYACPYDGCEKAYIHEYKLKLHLRKEHPGRNVNVEEHSKQASPLLAETSDHDDHITIKRDVGKNRMRKKPNLIQQMPPTKLQRTEAMSPVNLNFDSASPSKESKEMFEQDSEETEDNENGEETDDDDDDDETDDE